MTQNASLKERYGPWAVIAGASEGVGRAFARQLAIAGIPSVLIARRQGPLTQLCDEIRLESGIECVTATIDLAAVDACERIVAAVGQREVGLLLATPAPTPMAHIFSIAASTTGSRWRIST